MNTPQKTCSDLNIFASLFKEEDCVAILDFPNTLKESYGLFGNGLFVRRTFEGIGSFCVNKYPLQIPLDQNYSESFELKVSRKIPYSVLAILENIYSTVLQNIKSEVMTLVYYNKVKDTFRVHIPKQKVNFSNVSYTYIPPSENEILILNSHSHSSFSAFFSSVDSADEKAPCFYLVIGNNDKENRSYAFRVKYGNFERQLELEEIFDFSNTDEEIVFDNSEINNIEQVLTYAQNATRGYSSSNSYYRPTASSPYSSKGSKEIYSEFYDDFELDHYDYSYSDFSNKTVNTSIKGSINKEELELELSVLKSLVYFKSPKSKIYKKLLDIVDLIDEEKGPEFEDFVLDLSMSLEVS